MRPVNALENDGRAIYHRFSLAGPTVLNFMLAVGFFASAAKVSTLRSLQPRFRTAIRPNYLGISLALSNYAWRFDFKLDRTYFK